MNVKGFYDGLGGQIVREKYQKTAQITRAEKALAWWDTASQDPGFDPHFKSRGEPIAANLRGTVKGFPDSMMCASLIDDLVWIIQKGQQ